MKNKYLPLLVASSFVLACASSSFAAMTVTLTQNTQKYSGANGGGEFKAVTSANGTFQTFCIDVGHSFKSGKTYDYTISQQTYANSGNNISIGTAWLYSQFLDGALTAYGYHYTDGSQNVYSATLLQSVLWGLEGEHYGTSANYFNINNPFYNAVVSKFGSLSLAEVDAGANNIYGVAVMNLFATNNTSQLAQSQLIRIPITKKPVPEPSTIVAGALLLLPLGVSALRIVRRKQAC
jgi:hypothetical protein